MTDLSCKNKGFIKFLLIKEPDTNLRTIYKLVKSLNTKEISNESIKQYVTKIRVLQKGGNKTIPGYHGLHNYFNICYMNAPIQYLFLNNSFKQLVSKRPDFTKFEKELKLLDDLNKLQDTQKYNFNLQHSIDIEKAKGVKLCNIFYYIFEAMDNKINTDVLRLENFTIKNENNVNINIDVYEQLFNLTLLIYKIPNKNYKNNNKKNLLEYSRKDQHTADEFIRNLVNNILSCQDNSEKENLYIKDSLYKKCKNSTIEYESKPELKFFLDLVNDKNRSSISEIINDYVTTKHFTDEGQYVDSCKSNTNPKGIITEERSVYDVSKITNLNIFLNRTKFNLTNGQPFKSGVEITANPIIEISNQQFKLIGIIKHLGDTPIGGHYVTFNYNEGKTILFDDAKVFYSNIDESNTGSILFLYEKTLVPINIQKLEPNAKRINTIIPQVIPQKINSKKYINKTSIIQKLKYLFDEYHQEGNAPLNIPQNTLLTDCNIKHSNADELHNFMEKLFYLDDDNWKDIIKETFNVDQAKSTWCTDKNKNIKQNESTKKEPSNYFMTIGTNKKNTTIENILKDLQEPEKLNIKTKLEKCSTQQDSYIQQIYTTSNYIIMINNEKKNITLSNEITFDKKVYILDGIIEHINEETTHSNGTKTKFIHFIAYVHKNNIWYKMDDSKDAKKINVNDFPKQPYFIFYKIKDLKFNTNSKMISIPKPLNNVTGNSCFCNAFMQIIFNNEMIFNELNKQIINSVSSPPVEVSPGVASPVAVTELNKNDYLCAEIYHYIIDNYTVSPSTQIYPKSYKKRNGDIKDYYSISNNNTEQLNYGIYSPNLITDTENKFILNNKFYDKYRTIYSTKPVKRKDLTGKNRYLPADIDTFLARLKEATNINKQKIF